MLKRLISSLALLLVAFLVVPLPLSAHVLKQDGPISGVLHMPPSDAPSAGASQKLGIAFGDPKNTFNINKCQCKVVLQLNDKAVQTVSLKPYFKDSKLSSTSEVMFPSIGIYDVLIKGSATDESFADFQLDYVVRVATSADGSQASIQGDGTSILIIAAGSLVILAMFAHISIKAGTCYKPKPNKVITNKR